MLQPVSIDMEKAFLANRVRLLAFFHARGTGDAAEDLLQEMWLRLPREGAVVGAPLSYLYRMAETLVINRYLSDTQGRKRDRAWTETIGPTVPGRSEEPTADRVMEAREAAARVLTALAAEGERAATIFRLHRIDGLSQREVAVKLGVSVSTVESDLRRAYRVLIVLRERDDEE